MKTKPKDRESTNVEDRRDGSRHILKQIGVGLAYSGVGIVNSVKKAARSAEEGFGWTGQQIAAKKQRRESERDLVMRQGLPVVGAAIKGKPIPSSGLYEQRAAKGPPPAWEYVAYGAVGLAVGVVVAPPAVVYGIGKALLTKKDTSPNATKAYGRFHAGQAAAAQVGKNMPSGSSAHLTTAQARQFATASDAYRGMQSANREQRAGDTFDRTYTQGPKAGVTEKVKNTRAKR